MIALEQAFRDYRQELENSQKKLRPTDGILGFGRSLKDDPCHERLDGRVKAVVDDICQAQPDAQFAERVVRMLLFRDDVSTWPQSAQWMLRAAERHTLPLIPYLTKDAAADITKEYKNQYKRWERLPAQERVYKALVSKAG